MFNSTRTLIGVLGLLVGVLGSTSAAAGALTIPHTFAADTTAVAAEVNANFDSVKTAVDDNAGRVAALEVMVTALQNTINTLQAELATVRDLAPFVSVDPNVIEGLTGPHVILTGVNVHIRSGSGRTDDIPPGGPNPCPTCVTGLGNLVVGYNEANNVGRLQNRGGSHNVIIGIEHQYTSWAGLVVGESNTISGQNATVTGGAGNTASGDHSSVSGGTGQNVASGAGASISGGSFNEANGSHASVSGGRNNIASGDFASVSGGNNNTANGLEAPSVSGGSRNTASGTSASVSGGQNNEANGNFSVVLGGNGNITGTTDDIVP